MKIKTIDKDGNEKPLNFFGQDVKRPKIVIEEESEEEIRKEYEERIDRFRRNFAEELEFKVDEVDEIKPEYDTIHVFIGSKNENEVMGDVENVAIRFVLNGLNVDAPQAMENVYEFRDLSEDDVRQILTSAGLEEMDENHEDE